MEADLIISREMLQSLIEEAVRRGAREAINEARQMKPLMTEADVLRTLAIGRATFIKKVQPKLPPIWVEGQKRWHPDSVDAYLRHISAKRR